MVGVKYKYKGILSNGLEVISEPEKIGDSNTIFLRVLCRKCQKLGVKTLREISNSTSLPCECVRPKNVYKNHNIRTTSLFDYWMEKWNPETHKPNTYKLPYFSGTVGREYIRGFSYVDKDTYYKWKDYMFVHATYVKLNSSKDNIERGLNNLVKYRFLHREIKSKEGLITDHINRNKLDNRPDNLRPVSHSINSANSKPKSISKWKGMTYRKGFYKVHMFKSGRQIYLGSYRDEESASIAYDLGTLSLRGLKTYTNYKSSRYTRPLDNLDDKVIQVINRINRVKRTGMNFNLDYSIFEDKNHSLDI
jgi:hypothetical protein